MALHDELERLAELHKAGTLTDNEYAAAKAKLLSRDENTLGKAANRYVKLQAIGAVVSILLALAFFFFFVQPQWNKMGTDMQDRREQFDKRWEQMGKDMPRDFTQKGSGSGLDQEK